MNRRFPAWWALVVLLAAIAWETVRILQSPDFPDQDGHIGLIGAMVSAVLLFGGWPRQKWIPAGASALIFVLVGGVANARYVCWLHEMGGVPANWLLELGAVFQLLAVPAGLIAGAVSAIACSRGWLRRTA